MKSHGRGNGYGVLHHYGLDDRPRRMVEPEEKRIAREADEDERLEKHLKAHRKAMTRPPFHMGHPPEVLAGRGKDRRGRDFQVQRTAPGEK